MAALTIARLYFSEDTDDHDPTLGDSNRHRTQAALIELASEQVSSVLSDNLKVVAKTHGGARLKAAGFRRVAN